MTPHENTADLYTAYDKLTGLGFLELAMRTGIMPPFESLVEFKIVAVRAGFAQISGLPQPKFFNVMQRVHGGFAASLMDTGLGVPC